MRGSDRALVALTLLAALLAGCSGSSGPTDGHTTVTPVTAAQLQTLLAGAEPPVILDVRTAAEFAAGHIAGSINIPLQELEDRLNELNTARPTACVCSSGVRSDLAARTLVNAGFGTVYNLQGGLATWRDPLEGGV